MASLSSTGAVPAKGAAQAVPTFVSSSGVAGGAGFSSSDAKAAAGGGATGPSLPTSAAAGFTSAGTSGPQSQPVDANADQKKSRVMRLLRFKFGNEAYEEFKAEVATEKVQLKVLNQMINNKRIELEEYDLESIRAQLKFMGLDLAHKWKLWLARLEAAALTEDQARGMTLFCVVYAAEVAFKITPKHIAARGDEGKRSIETLRDVGVFFGGPGRPGMDDLLISHVVANKLDTFMMYFAMGFGKIAAESSAPYGFPRFLMSGLSPGMFPENIERFMRGPYSIYNYHFSAVINRAARSARRRDRREGQVAFDPTRFVEGEMSVYYNAQINNTNTFSDSKKTDVLEACAVTAMGSMKLSEIACMLVWMPLPRLAQSVFSNTAFLTNVPITNGATAVSRLPEEIKRRVPIASMAEQIDGILDWAGKDRPTFASVFGLIDFAGDETYDDIVNTGAAYAEMAQKSQQAAAAEAKRQYEEAKAKSATGSGFAAPAAATAATSSGVTITDGTAEEEENDGEGEEKAGAETVEEPETEIVVATPAPVSPPPKPPAKAVATPVTASAKKAGKTK